MIWRLMMSLAAASAIEIGGEVVRGIIRLVQRLPLKDYEPDSLATFVVVWIVLHSIMWKRGPIATFKNKEHA